ncbi:MAG TPA: hypothetical protein VGX23_05400 [Actinocrinis sp.]|nr:hypothetical protein [Actinocrinis sp.]
MSIAAGASTHVPKCMLDQVALAWLIESGAYDRRLRTVRRRYRTRRAALIQAIHAELPTARISGADAGLHLVVHLDETTAPADHGRATTIVRTGADLGLHLCPLDFYRGTDQPPTTQRALVLGYGNLPDHAVDEAVALLRTAVDTNSTHESVIRRNR